MPFDFRLQSSPVFKVAIVLIIGIIAGKYSYSCLPTYLWLVLSVASFMATLALWKHPLCQSATTLATFMFVGAFAMTHALGRTNVKLPHGKVGYEAVLISEPVVHGKVVMVDMFVVSDDSEPIKVRASILCDTIDNRWRRLHVGDGIRAESGFYEPRNFSNATFDYAGWLKEHGFAAETFIYYTDWIKAEVSLVSLSYLQRTTIAAMKFRQRLLSQYQFLGASGQDYAVLAAMTLGDKSALSRELKDDYSVSGASHVLALSGLHLGIIYAILSMLFLKYRRKWFSQLAIMIAIWSYVVIVGMSASVVRSAVMLTVLSFVAILNRQSLSVNSLSVAAVIMLLWNPLNLYDVGFEMSFMAVLGIVMFCPLLVPSRPKSSRVLRVVFWLWNMIAVSVAAQLGTAPLVAYYFGRFSCYFALTNLIVIPCATVVLYGSVVLLALGWWNAAGAIIAGAILSVIKLMNAVLHGIASLPGASIDGIRLSVAQTAGIYAVILSIFLIAKFARRGDRWL